MSQPCMDLFTINITSEMQCNGFDLNGEEIEMVDVFPRNYSGFHFGNSAVVSLKKIGDGQVPSMSAPRALVEIDLPIYERSIQQQVEGNDLSINSCILSLFAVSEAIGDIRNCAVTDSVYDAIQKKVIRCPIYDVSRDFKKSLLSSSLKTILQQGPHVHFWRVIKLAVRYYDEGWTINPELIADHAGLYNRWIGSEEYVKDEANQRDLVIWNFSYGLATTIKEYESMLSTFAAIGFEEQLKGALRSNRSFEEKWLDALKQKEEDVINIYSANGYHSVK